MPSFTNNIIAILYLARMYQQQSSNRGYNSYSYNNKSKNPKDAKSIAEIISNKIETLAAQPMVAEISFCTKVLTQFYNLKAIMPDETFTF